MPIADNARDLEPGVRLAAIFKGVRYVCTVGRNEAGRTTYILEHKPDEVFYSPSAAGSDVMNGTACNGWRFWTLENELVPRTPRTRVDRATVAPKPPKAKVARAPRAPKLKQNITVVRNQKGVQEGYERFMCGECGDPFIAEALPAGELPETCPEGHFAFADEQGVVRNVNDAPEEDEAEEAEDEEDEDEEDEEEAEEDEDEDEEKPSVVQSTASV